MKSSGSGPANIFFGKKPSRKLATLAMHDNVTVLQQHRQPINEVVDRFQGKWKEHVGIAKIAWGVLTEDELLKTEGRKEKLAGLIQQRYAMSLAAANEAVESLIEKCGY